MRAARAGLVSLPGALRAYGDIFSRRPLSGPDVSVGSFARSRLGPEALDALVDPVLAGTRAGDPDEMSLAAATPQIDEIARKHRSLLTGLAAARRAGNVDLGPPPFLGLRGGMQTLVDRLAGSLGERVTVVSGSRVERIEAGPTVVVGGASHRFEAVILAVPAFVAGGMVVGLDAAASELLNAVEYASVAILTLTFPERAVIVPPGVSGVLIPRSEGTTLAAFTWYSAKWPGSAPENSAVVRAFVGRAAGERSLDLTDAALVKAATAELRAIAGIEAQPDESRVFRWERAMPQYRVGHLDRIAQIESRLEAHAIFPAGAGYRGSGIPDCVRQARAAAVKATRSAAIR